MSREASALGIIILARTLKHGVCRLWDARVWAFFGSKALGLLLPL